MLSQVLFNNTLSERKKMDKLLIKKQFKQGETIVTEGSESYNVYVIVSGEAAMTKEHFGKEVDIRVLKKGDVFGALSLIAKSPRSATIKAKTDLEVGMIYRDDFVSVMEKLPEEIRVIMQELMDELKGSYELSANLPGLTKEMLDVKGRIESLKRKKLKESLGEIPEIFQTIFLSLDNSLTEMVHNFFTLATQLDKTVVEVDELLKRNFGQKP
jgi:CRP-like cAMP-binding protein